MIYLVTIMVVAFRFGRAPSLAASAVSIAAYDFFFVPPYYTFSVEHARHLLTFAMMLLVGLTISSLTFRLCRRGSEARIREGRTAALGVIALRLPSLEMLEVEHHSFIEAFVRQAALAVDRARLTEEARTSALRSGPRRCAVRS